MKNLDFDIIVVGSGVGGATFGGSKLSPWYSLSGANGTSANT